MTTMPATPTPERPRLTPRRVAQIIWPWRWQLGGILVTVAAGAAMVLVPPLILKSLIDDHIRAERAEGVLLLAMAYLGARAALAWMGFATTYLVAATAQQALHRLRVHLFAHLQKLPIRFYDHMPIGDVISRCTADVETIQTVFSTGVIGSITSVFNLVAVAAGMVYLCPPLAGAACVVLPPLVLTTWYFPRRARQAQRDERRAVGVANTHLQETLAGAEVVQAFARQPAFVSRFRHILSQMVRARNRVSTYASFYSPLTRMQAAATLGLVLWLGARWSISPGTLIAFALMFDRFFTPIQRIGDQLQLIQQAVAGGERIAEIFSHPAEAPSEGDGPIRARGALVELKDLWAGYVPDQPVLRGISLSVGDGEHVAVVGRTGAGKSTLLHVLGGLYEPWSGTVRVAGLDPRVRGEDERRKVVGVVPQAIHLFSGTVRENITLRDASVTDEAVARALRICGADGFVSRLPKGMETPLGGSGGGEGVQLSAGQKQLLALARALVHQPPVLLLDEATAAIDSQSEAALQQALRSEATGRNHGVLTIAHRLSTAVQADRVVLLEAGRIVEQGPPDDLIRRGGRFAALLELEAAGWDWRDDT